MLLFKNNLQGNFCQAEIVGENLLNCVLFLRNSKIRPVMKISTQFGSVIFILILISLSIISCNEKSGPKIGFMLPHMTIKRYIIEKEEFTAKIKELGERLF